MTPHQEVLAAQASEPDDTAPLFPDLQLAEGEVIDADAIFQEIRSRGPEAAPADIRRATIEVLRGALKSGRARIAEGIAAHPLAARDAVRAYSVLTDGVIRTVFRVGRELLHPNPNPTEGERIAVLAVGGYGRGEMAPFSDVDLLFLMPWKVTPSSESLIESMLYILWDLHLKVGHASRSVQECVRLGRDDYTIRTALLENRFLVGDPALAEALQTTLQRDLFEKTAADFIEAKLEERSARHKKQGGQRYLVEPNVKEGKGGLRDLQTLFWIGKYIHNVDKAADLVALGLFRQEEYDRFHAAETFLMAVRNHLHLAAGRAMDQLTFDLQVEIADRLGYVDRTGRRAVEHFMQDYFRHATIVGEVTRIFLTALEAKHVKSAPSLVTLLRRRKPVKEGFDVRQNRLDIAKPKAFFKDPLNLLRLFEEALRTGYLIHPDAMRLVTANLDLIDDSLRTSPEANRIFFDTLLKHGNPERALRRMNELGLLAAFVPEFEPIVAMMQFNMYHSYTVDEHLIRSVGVLAGIESGELSHEHPLSTELLPTMQNERAILYVALLLHDIAKGRPEDHSIAGAKVARKLCPRLGFSKEDTELIAWIIEEHLTMSMIAQSRDLSDRKTIVDFVAKVQTVRRLKVLLVLTVCDIRAVGPGVWNGWKGQLLRTLYTQAELAITGGFSEIAGSAGAKVQRAKLEEALADWDEVDRNKYSNLHYDNYILTVPLEDQIRHAHFVRDADKQSKPLATTVKTDAFQAITEITILAQDHPRLLSVIAGCCSSVGAKIDGAHVFTTGDGRALDTILLEREFEDDEDEIRRAERICVLIEDVLSGKNYLPAVLSKPVRKGRRTNAFQVDPVIKINNALSDRFSVIEVQGLDRFGLLSELTQALSDLQLDIRSAHITTFGEKIIDNFYVTDLLGDKITNPARQNKIKKTLANVFVVKNNTAAKAEKKTGEKTA